MQQPHKTKTEAENSGEPATEVGGEGIGSPVGAGNVSGDHDDFDLIEGDLEGDDSESSVAPIDEGKSTEPWRDKVARMAAEVAAREGCEIYDFDFVGGGNSRALRIFIDKVSVVAADGTSTNKGVSIEDCSNVSRGLNLLLDVDDVIPGGAYNLEVSSPGLERPLRSATHFKRAAGARAFVKTFESFAELNPQLDESSRMKLGKSKQLEGVVVGIEGDDVETEAGHGNAVLVFDAETGGTAIRVKLPLGKVTKANTVFVFEANDKPVGGKKAQLATGKKANLSPGGKKKH